MLVDGPGEHCTLTEVCNWVHALYFFPDMKNGPAVEYSDLIGGRWEQYSTGLSRWMPHGVCKAKKTVCYYRGIKMWQHIKRGHNRRRVDNLANREGIESEIGF